MSKDIASFAHEWMQAKEKSVDKSIDVDDDDGEEETSLKKCNEQRKLYECDVEPGCITEFAKFGNLINHIVVSRHYRVIEKYSLKDTAMTMYHSKLEEVESRRMISLNMNSIDMTLNETSQLSGGWALPKHKPNIEFSDKQRDYLIKKFDEGVSDFKHWKPKDIVLDMENLIENNKFYFSANEILKESQIRSYFGRIKQERQISAAQQTSTNKVSLKDQVVKDFNSENDDEQFDSDLQEMENDLEDIENAAEEVKTLENVYTDAKKALESSSDRVNRE